MSTKVLKTLVALLAIAAATGPARAQSTQATDTLTRSWTGVSGSGSGYSNWSGLTLTSDAVYAGNTAGGNNAIQLRTTNSNSGIVTTTSGGTVASVTVTWNSYTNNNRTLQVYGKHSAYSAASDLYNSNACGDLLGTIVKGESTSLTITGDYEYIGLRSANGAMYLDEIQIVWNVAGSGTTTPQNYTLDSIPVAWTVTADSVPVTVTPYTSGDTTLGHATITSGAHVELIPPAAVKPLVKSVTLVTAAAEPIP